jgi:threonine/homoserine/homoserine lactone efflux protein
MLGIHDYPLFIASAVLLNVTPGPDTIYILARSVGEGRKAGLLSVFGIASGLLLHTVAVSAGLSAVLLASARLFTAVKLIGGLYLVFLGVKSLFSKSGVLMSDGGSARNQTAWKIYRQGVFTNALNPKVALFFLALLPQFVNKTTAAPGLAFFLLGASFIATCTLWCLLLAFFASSFSAFIRRHERVAKWIDAGTGVLFIGLGARLALAKQTD